MLLSELMGREVVTESGSPLGRVRDLTATVGAEHPTVSGLVVSAGQGSRHVVPWSAVSGIAAGRPIRHRALSGRLWVARDSPSDVMSVEGELSKGAHEARHRRCRKLEIEHVVDGPRFVGRGGGDIVTSQDADPGVVLSRKARSGTA